MSNISESLERDLSNDVFKSKISGQGHNLLFSALAIIHGMAKLANSAISQIWSLTVPFEMSLSKRSEIKLDHEIQLSYVVAEIFLEP